MLRKYYAGARLSAVTPAFSFGHIARSALLPPVPVCFDRGHYFPKRTLADPYPLGMLGNDSVGDCTIAGPMHVSMLWNAISENMVKFTTLDALDDYRDACGYVFNKPSTDVGGDATAVAAYWQKTGMRDWRANRHKISAFVSLDPANFEHLMSASYFFDGGCGLIAALPGNAEDQFDAGEPWDGAAANDDELHFIPLAYRGNDNLNHVYTWGADQPATDAWIKANVRQALGYISQELLVKLRSIEGFTFDQLLTDGQNLAVD